MKKIALYILAAAAILAGCSKKNIETTPVNSEDAWMYDATLPVPVRFSVSNDSFTKAQPIENVDALVGKKFGFYAVNNGADEDEGAWNTSVPDMEMPQGAEAVAVKKTDGRVMFEFTEGPYFYEQTDWTPYTFYGYHAHVNDTANEDWGDNQGDDSFSNRISVHLNIGHTDILWGKAEAKDEYGAWKQATNGAYGFNAPYLRNEGLQPVINFEHVTACMQFNALAVASGQTGAESKVIEVIGFNILQTPVEADLFIAHRDSQYEGTFAAGVPGTISITGLTETSPKELTPLPSASAISENSTSLGDPLFICPTTSAVKIELTYRVKGSDEVYPYTVTLPNPTSEYKKGYKYSFCFKIYSPEEIRIEADVKPYVSAWDGYEDVDVAKE